MTGVCPDCGTPLPKDAALMGLCPQCLLSMAFEDDEPETLHGVRWRMQPDRSDSPALEPGSAPSQKYTMKLLWNTGPFPPTV